MKIRFWIGCVMSVVCNAAFAESSFSTLLQWQGGITAVAQYLKYPGGYIGSYGISIQDALLDVQTSSRLNRSIGFRIGLGINQPVDFVVTTAPYAPISVGLQFGWLQLNVVDNLTIQLGQLRSQLGYESSISYQKRNITHGAVSSVIENVYPAARVAYTLDKWSGYTEFSGRETVAAGTYAAGTRFQLSPQLATKLNFLSAPGKRHIFNIEMEANTQSLSIGLDYYFHSNKQVNVDQDNSAHAIAFYFSKKIHSQEYPFRIELISDGNSNIYRYDWGYSFTFSPTTWLNKSQYVRFELVYAWGDAKPFLDDDRHTKEQYAAALQMGYVF